MGVDCSDYKPGAVMGKVRPVCAYYVSAPPEAAGVCTRQDRFMCVYWVEAQNDKERRKDADVNLC